MMRLNGWPVARWSLIGGVCAALAATAPPAQAVEYQLAGIRLGDPATKVIELYGHPEGIVGPRGRLFSVPPGWGQKTVEVLEGLYFAGRGQDAMPLWATLVLLEAYRPDERQWVYRMPGGTAVMAFAVRGGTLLETYVSQIVFAAQDPRRPHSTGLDFTSGGISLGASYAALLLQHGFPRHTAPFEMMLVMTPAQMIRPDGTIIPAEDAERQQTAAPASSAPAGGGGLIPGGPRTLSAGGGGGDSGGGGLQPGGPDARPRGVLHPEPTAKVNIGQPITFSKAMLLRYDNLEAAVVNLKVARLHIW